MNSAFGFYEGVSGDDFLALGVRNGRIVHKYNLGSGVASVISERLNLRSSVHTVHFGRDLKNGWLKVCLLIPDILLELKKLEM